MCVCVCAPLARAICYALIGDSITLVRGATNNTYNSCTVDDVVDKNDPLCSSTSPLLCKYRLVKSRTEWVGDGFFGAAGAGRASRT
jgi:hypothetical protein